MITFTISIVLLIIGYFVYGSFVSHVFGPDDRKTPVTIHPDGVDYIKMPIWRIYMIQFLNIAGTGPIFGAIMGALFGTSSYLWIVFGCIFGGAVHDYMAGMLSLRNDGESLPETVGRYLGKRAKLGMLIFCIIFMPLVGAVFVYSPAIIIDAMTKGVDDVMFWIIIIFLYYVLATLLPIDKIIGKIYPVFAVALILMALGLFVMLYVNFPAIPEIWDGLQNKNPDTTQPIIPCLCITIACGAISGFHATQSPMMARCIKHEKYARPVFYGSMITEGVVALIWATVASYFFFDGGVANSANMAIPAPKIVQLVSEKWLGDIGYIFVLFGVVALPITTGDTAFRSSRLMVADFFHLKQDTNLRRVLVALPLFLFAIIILYFIIQYNNGFNIIWRYFGWANQAISIMTLFAITVYLAQQRKLYWIALIPALFMTFICVDFLCVSTTVLSLPESISLVISSICTLVAVGWFFLWLKRYNSNRLIKSEII